MKKRKVLIIILTIAICLHANAQTGKLFDADKQLTSSFTSQVYLDRDGFLWVVTRNGLNKYDGYQFHIIKKGVGNGQGMASNYVNCMTQDADGLFYIGMYGALQTYDGNSFRDVQVRDDRGAEVTGCYITCFLRCADGSVLVGTSGHGILKMEDRSHARQLGGVLKGIHTANAMLEDGQGRIWIATADQGLIEYDGKTARHYFTSGSTADVVRCLATDRDGSIYAGTMTAGVFVASTLNPPPSTFRPIALTAGKPVSAIYCRRDGQLMFGYDGQGVAIYNPKTGQVTDNPFYSREVDLNMSKVYSIVEDSSGNVWLGLLQKGIFMQPSQTRDFDYMGFKLGPRNVIGQACVISTMIDSRGRCWVGTDKDGLYCLDENQRLIKHYKDDVMSSVMSLCEDHSGRIWAGTYGEGFGYIDANGAAFHRFPQYLNTSIFSLQCTKDGVLWAATMGQGLLRLDLSTLHPSPSTLKSYTMQEHATSDSTLNSIVNNYIQKISLSPDEKRVYVATTMGLCCLDTEKDSWTSVFGRNCLNYGVPCRIAKEYDGVLWVGTNDGLFSYDLSSRQLQHYTTGRGLVDNGIASIERDKDGRFWIGTDHGLCCYNPLTGQTRSFFVDNGLQSNEYSDGASFAVDRGDRVVMVFAGTGGISWFHPERIHEAQWDAKVNLVSFIVNHQPINSQSVSDGYHICDTTVIAAERFELAHHDNTFTLQFSTLTYVNPEHITYLYGINGENLTRLQSGVNEVTLTHLPPGTYRFRVVAQRNGVQTPERTFTVVIHAPWYRSTLAYIIYLLLLAAAVWAYLRFRRRKEQDRLHLQEHIHAEQMADAKLRFFMNISHEIRTPMTLIVAPLLSLMKQDDDPQRRSVYKTIRRNAERILGLINQMMDLRKIDKGQMQMHMRETDLISFVGDIHTLFSQQSKVKNTTFTYEHDTDTLPVWIDRDNFDKVIVNILSNAFKFTPPGGKIRIKIHKSNAGTAVISVRDSGEGIPEGHLEHIFERFYQSPSHINDRRTGTGIGLDLTRSLVELHHGTIEAHNNTDGPGCEFVVTIPLGNGHLKPEEMITESSPQTPDLLLEAEEPDSGEAPVTPNISPTRKQRLVIVEDDQEIRDYLTSELQTDYDIASCADGREGLAEVLRSLPDLVISDIMMPEMDGNTLCSRIKTSPTTSHIPVILLTAKSRDEDQLAGLETGADAYIVKPFNMDILRRTITNMLAKNRMLMLKYGRNDQLEERVDKVHIKSPDERLLERVMAVINKNLSNADLSVDGIADEVGISRVHLHRKMKELTGQTPHDFIRNIRLKRAAHLLANQSMNITEVMYACGFNNAASFSTIFKRFYGLSPRDYMHEHAEQ